MLNIKRRIMAKRLTKRQKQKVGKFVGKNIVLVTILLIIIIGLLFFAYYKGWLDKFFKKGEEPTLSTAGGYVTEVSTLKDIKVNFLNVGQGDSMIVELPDGKNMIIDSGDKSNSAKNAIKNFTDSKNIQKFDYLLLTHADSDHVGNMSWVIDTYEIKYIFRPNNYSDNSISSSLTSDFNTKTEGGYVATSQVYANFMVSAYNEKCPVEIVNKDSDFSNKVVFNGTEYTYTFDFLTPVADKSQVKYSDPNNYSPLVMLKFRDKTIMFTGDAEEKMLSEYVDNYGSSNNVDVLKVGHHGSRNATTSEFIESIDPEYAVIQCGFKNKFKHPHPETLNILSGYDSNLKVYRNDTNGLITLNLGSGLEFNLENPDLTYNFTCGEDMPSTLSLSFEKYLENRKILVA